MCGGRGDGRGDGMREVFIFHHHGLCGGGGFVFSFFDFFLYNGRKGIEKGEGEPGVGVCRVPRNCVVAVGWL